MSADPADPASNLVRVQAFLTTTSSAVDLTLGGAEWANAVSEDASVRVIIDGATVHVTRKSSGEIDIPLDMILGSVLAGGTLSWTLTPVSPGTSALEMFNANVASTRLVDRFDGGTSVGNFTTSADLLREGGPLSAVPRTREHLVVAFFYPWWTLDSWTNDPQIHDSPVPQYSTDNPADLQQIMSTAKSTGLDALVVTWSGKDTDGGIHHQRMLRCLTAAGQAGFKVAALLETTRANPQHVDGDADPDTVLQELSDIVDDYASQASYLRVENRPVVMAYAAQRLTQADWKDALGRLRASGRDVLLVGEGSNNTRLGAMDGQFYYPSNDQPGDGIRTFDRVQGLNVRTYHLLPGDTIGRRVWAATVSPGYDDTHINDGRVPRVTDRANGAYYKTQWQAALDNRADWIAITSWNEYFENTEIEATKLYGSVYLDLTKSTAAMFRSLNPVAASRPGR